MKSSFALLAFVAAAVAQIPGLPSCANSCINLPAECQITDYKCICTDSSFISGISCCVSQKCSASDQAVAIKFAQGLCGAYGATVPTVAGCSSAAASSTAAPSSSAAASSSAAPTPVAAVNGTTGGNQTTVTTTAQNTVTATTTTTNTVSAANTAGGNNIGPQAGLLLGGVMAGMALL